MALAFHDAHEPHDLRVGTDARQARERLGADGHGLDLVAVHGGADGSRIDQHGRLPRSVGHEPGKAVRAHAERARHRRGGGHHRGAPAAAAQRGRLAAGLELAQDLPQEAALAGIQAEVFGQIAFGKGTVAGGGKQRGHAARQVVGISHRSASCANERRAGEPFLRNPPKEVQLDTAAWEKGSVENANRHVRRWYPKGTDFSRVSALAIQALQNFINSIPRQSLQGASAHEAVLAAA